MNVCAVFLSGKSFKGEDYCHLTYFYNFFFYIFRPGPRSGSYEDLDNIVQNTSDTTLELKSNNSENDETQLDIMKRRRQSMKRLVRQSSTVDTQKTGDGSIQLTYWF